MMSARAGAGALEPATRVRRWGAWCAPAPLPGSACSRASVMASWSALSARVPRAATGTWAVVGGHTLRGVGTRGAGRRGEERARVVLQRAQQPGGRLAVRQLDHLQARQLPQRLEAQAGRRARLAQAAPLGAALAAGGEVQVALEVARRRAVMQLVQDAWPALRGAFNRAARLGAQRAGVSGPGCRPCGARRAGRLQRRAAARSEGGRQAAF